MEEEENAEQEITLVIQKLERNKKKFMDGYKTEPKKFQKMIESSLNEIKELLETYKLRYTNDGKNVRAEKKFKSMQKDLKSLEKEFKEFKLKTNPEQDNEPKGLRQPKREGKLQDYARLGDKYQKDGLDRLMGIEKDLNDNLEMVKVGNEELDRQAEKLMEANENVSEMKTALKRSMELITKMSRDLYADKFIRIMTILILLIFVTIIVIAVFKKKDTSTTTTGTTTTTTNTTTAITSIDYQFGI